MKAGGEGDGDGEGPHPGVVGPPGLESSVVAVAEPRLPVHGPGAVAGLLPGRAGGRNGWRGNDKGEGRGAGKVEMGELQRDAAVNTREGNTGANEVAGAAAEDEGGDRGVGR